VTAEMLGRPVECGGCGRAFVPDPPRRFDESRPRYRRRDDDFDDDDQDDYDYDEARHPRKPRSDLGIASLVIGVLSLPMVLCCPYLMLPAAVLAIVLGVLGLKTQNRTESIIGIVTGGLSLVGSVAMITMLFAMMAAVPPPPAAPAPAPVKSGQK
jgi:hypothetical protein